MRWLITGGCGFLGANLADRCLARDDEIIVLDNLSRAGADQNLTWLRTHHGAAWRMVQGDVRDADHIAALMAETKPDAVAHLSGQVAMTSSLANPRLDFETNALGTLNVLEAVRLHHPKAIVFYSSTNKVYGDLEWVRFEEQATRYTTPDFPAGFDEHTPLSFASPYGCSKGCADQYMLDYARMYGIRTVVFRHSSMYGGRQFATFDQGWIGWFCMQALATMRNPDHRFTIAGNGKQVRDVLHVDDLLALYLHCAISHIDRSSGEVFNIGGGMAQSLSLLELLAWLEAHVGVTLNFDRLPPRSSDQKVFVANNAKAAHRLGWQPRVGAAEGIQRMLDWLQTGMPA